MAEGLLFSVNSAFIAGIVSESLVGVVYSLASVAALCLLAYLPKILRQAGAPATLTVLLVMGAAAALTVALGPATWVLGALVLFIAIPQVAPAITDMYVEESSRVGERGKAVGASFSFMNLAYAIGPVIAGFIIARSGFSTVYFIAGVAFIIALLAANRFTKRISLPHTRRGNLWKGFTQAWRNKNLRVVLTLVFLLHAFFAWMVIYTPLYLQTRFGFGYETLGLIFSIMIVPYLLLEYPLGRIADKWLGEKELLIGGFTIIAITVGVIPVIASGSWILWAAILFATRVGSAIVESMSATYFYKKTQASEADVIALFRDARPLAYLIAPVVASIVVTKLSIGSLFPILGVIMLIGALLSTRLKDTR